MKICDVTQFYSPVSGGVKRYISEKRRYVERFTQDEHYLVIPGSRTAHERQGRLHVCTIQSPQINRTSRYRILLSTHRVRDFLDEARPDVIEAGDPYHLAWVALRAGGELRVPVFGFYHSHFPEAYLRTVLKYCGGWVRDAVLAYAQDYIVRLYRQFQATLVPSDHLRGLLNDWGVHNAVTLKLGVDTESFCPGPAKASLRDQLGIPARAFVLLFVGRLSSEKGLATLLDAFEQLHARGRRDCHLFIIGDGPLRRCLPAVRRATGGALTWRHYLDDNAQLADCYRLANLFVHPGVCETFGLVILEAQACGCPAVGIRGSYMDANVHAGLEHWAGENSAASLADAIERFQGLDLPALGREAAERVHAEYAWPRVFQRLWHHYSQGRFERARPPVYGLVP